MICYRDMTFCDFHKDCKNGGICSRSLTKEVKEKADKFRLPICQFISKPTCWEAKDDKDKRTTIK